MIGKKGFTLTELMVVILIIAILIAVAVPLYLASVDRAVVRAAQSRLKQVVNASKEVAGGGTAIQAVSGTESGIAYGDQAIGDLDPELDTITLVTAAPTGVEVQVQTNTPVGGITFNTFDANNTLRSASITDAGVVSIN